MKKLIWIIVIIVVVGLIWWAGSGNERESAIGEPIRIGVIAPLTGIIADYGEEMQRGVEAAQVEGVEFVYEDSQCDAKTTVSAYRKLTEIDEIKFIIGPGCGAPQEVITPLLEEDQTIVVVPSAATQELYARSGGNFYNLQYALEDESKFIADEMYDAGYEKVVLIGYQNNFSKIHEDTFIANYQGEIVEHVSFPFDASDTLGELTKIKHKEFDAIFSTDITFLFGNGMKRLGQLGIEVPVFSQYATELPAVRGLAEGIIYSFPDDVIEGEGAVYGLSKQATELLSSIVLGCTGDYACVKEGLDQSGHFDENGVSVRPLLLKTIKDGQAVPYVVE
ncbi:MAG: penicillin-binding protein activator [Patescibacteria group bacterium]|nr:penicillin-binding protein activator [Patescibacteria group bacterium]